MIEGRHVTRVDGCQCRKGSDMWGAGYWHWRELSERDCKRMAREDMNAFVRQYGPIPSAERDSREEELVERYRAYVGKPVAIERCPTREDIARRAMERRGGESFG